MPSPAEAQLESFISKFTPEHQILIRAVRRWMRKRMPTAYELVYDNYNFFVIGYGATDRASEAVLSIAASARGVGICFIHGKGLPDPEKLLRGSGNQTRSLHLDDVSTLSRPGVSKLIDDAIARSTSPFARSGKHQLVIR